MGIVPNDDLALDVRPAELPLVSGRENGTGVAQAIGCESDPKVRQRARLGIGGCVLADHSISNGETTQELQTRVRDNFGTSRGNAL